MTIEAQESTEVGPYKGLPSEGVQLGSGTSSLPEGIFGEVSSSRTWNTTQDLGSESA